MTELLLAIDQGTSGLKLTLFDLDGQVIADKTKSYETTYPFEGYVEQDCDVWWQVAAEGIKEMLIEKRIDPSCIKGIGVDGISWACIPIDHDGNVLYRTMIWLDRRATKEAEWMKTVAGEKNLIELSGNPVDAAYITPKMLWLKNNEPEIFAKTYKFLQSNGFIAYRLTGVLSQDRSQGYGFHFYTMKTGELDVEMAGRLGLSTDLVAPLRNSHEVIGGVTAEAAKLTGLLPGTPVVAGGLDAACCTLGAGVIHVGQTQEQGGQAGGMSICLDEALIHPKLILGNHVIPGKWLLQGGTTGGGGTLNWFNRELGSFEQAAAQALGKSSFAILSEEAEDVVAGSEGLLFLPYMKGERSPLWNGNAKGVYYGLSFDKTRSHMIRSMMEGVAYSLKHNLDTALEVGAKVAILSSVGGSANSQVWTQIKADITQTPIEVPYSDHATSLGAAILAGVGVGLFESFEEAVKRTVKIRRTYTPNSANFAIYTQGYANYIRLSRLLVETMFE
jgi:xylulokinase